MIIIIAAILFAGLLGVILLGSRSRRLVPAEHLNTDSKDAVKLALGLVATMTAILWGFSLVQQRIPSTLHEAK